MNQHFVPQPRSDSEPATELPLLDQFDIDDLTILYDTAVGAMNLYQGILNQPRSSTYENNYIPGAELIERWDDQAGHLADRIAQKLEAMLPIATSYQRHEVLRILTDNLFRCGERISKIATFIEGARLADE